MKCILMFFISNYNKINYNKFLIFCRINKFLMIKKSNYTKYFYITKMAYYNRVKKFILFFKDNEEINEFFN